MTVCGIIVGIMFMIKLKAFLWKWFLYWIVELLFLTFGYYVCKLVRSVYREIKQSAEEPVVNPLVKIIAILGLIFSSLLILANIIGFIKYQQTNGSICLNANCLMLSNQNLNVM